LWINLTEMGSIFTAIFEKADGWYIGYVEELPSANTQGKTLEEAQENLHEAIELNLLSNRKLAKKEISEKEFICEEIKVAL
jgi:predicted RNase H-like HicB family nuclease